MKTLFSLLTLLFISLSSLATHIVGGDVHYEQTGDDTYVVTLTVYRDCGPDNTNETGFDAFANVGVYENGVLIQNLSLDLNNAEISNLTENLNDPCLILPEGVCVERAVYSATITLPDSPFGYDLVYQRCCRNPSILNIQLPDESGATFWTQIPSTDLVLQNSSPLFNNLPPLGLCVNSAFIFDHSATDLDGDDLVYTFCDPLLGADDVNPAPNPPPPPPYLSVIWLAGFSADYPITSSPPLTIDPVTGSITGTPSAAGQYVYAVCVEEYRDGVLLSRTNRDFQMNVVLCGQSNIAAIEEPDPCQGTTIQFENDSFGGSGWFWDFGVEELDSDTSLLVEPIYTYPDTGTYEVMLISNPGEFCADTSFQTVLVYQEVLAGFEMPGGACNEVGRIFSPLNTSEFDESTNFFWDFGPSASPSTSTAEDPGDILFTVEGTVQIELTVTEGGCVVSVVLNLEVEPLPLAEITDLEPCEGLAIAFENNSIESDDYFWDFGIDAIESDTSDLFEPEFIYPDTGSFDVMLIAGPGLLCADTSFQTVLAFEPVIADFAISGGDCFGEGRLYFISNNGQFTDVAEFDWDFDANSIPSSSDLENPEEIIFTSGGVYNIDLTITEGICSDSQSVEIVVDPIPIAVIDAQNVFCDGLELELVNLSVNTASYFWQFGHPEPNSTSTEQNPSHLFPDYGDYLVTLIVSSGTSCADTTSIIVQLLEEDPIDLTYSLSVPGPCTESAEVSLLFTGEGADQITWDLGDGTLLEGNEFTYLYDSEGTYTITVYGYHELCEFEDQASTEIIIENFLLAEKLVLPNVFSPNNDGKNDLFLPFFGDDNNNPIALPEGRSILDYLEVWEIRIYNRWGALVFENTNVQAAWDGRIEGEPVSEGSYYCVVSYKKRCDNFAPITLEHDFTLMR